MTFRRLFTADGIHNYFWKARPVRTGRRHRRGELTWARTASTTASPSSAWAAPASPSTGTRASTTCCSTPPARPSPPPGVTKDDVDAYWLGTAQSGMSGMVLAKPLQLEGKPVTRVENMCATGSEALRQAAYAVASGAYDVAMAVGVEKVKDSGYQGLNAFPIPTDGTNRTLTAAAMFSMVAPAYAERYGVDRDELRRVLARIAVEEPPQRRPQPAGPVPPRDVGRADLRHAGGGRRPVGVRLRRRGRRRGRRHRRAGRGRPPLHRHAAAT